MVKYANEQTMKDLYTLFSVISENKESNTDLGVEKTLRRKQTNHHLFQYLLCYKGKAAKTLKNMTIEM